MELFTTRLDRLAPGTVFEAETGALVISTSRPFQDRHLVQFEGVGSREQADLLRGVVLRAEPVTDNEGDELWVHELVGRVVRDAAGEVLGKVAAVQANPASDLLVLDNGGLVPCRFIISKEAEAISVDIPEGLLDI